MTRDYPAKGKKPPRKVNPKAALAQAVEALMQEPFPERSDDETADQLHAELLLYDSRVGDAVMAIANSERVPHDELQFNPDLRASLETLINSGNAIAAADAARYLEYMHKLDELLQLARDIARGKKST